MGETVAAELRGLTCAGGPEELRAAAAGVGAEDGEGPLRRSPAEAALEDVPVDEELLVTTLEEEDKADKLLRAMRRARTARR